MPASLPRVRPRQNMPSPLFPPWTDHLVRPLLVIAVAAIIAVPVLLMVWVRTPYVRAEALPLEQPVAFDHRHHVRDDGIDCLYCHTTAMRTASAGIPPTAICLNCHNQIWNDSALLAVVWESAAVERPIRWRRVTSLPDFVFFNHAVHTTSGIGCETCHGRVDRMARVYQVQPMTMGWCLDCHRDPVPYVRPPEAITAMDWREGDARAQQARAAHVRRLTHCTACHR